MYIRWRTTHYCHRIQRGNYVGCTRNWRCMMLKQRCGMRLSTAPSTNVYKSIVFHRCSVTSAVRLQVAHGMLWRYQCCKSTRNSCLYEIMSHASANSITFGKHIGHIQLWIPLCLVYLVCRLIHIADDADPYTGRRLQPVFITTTGNVSCAVSIEHCSRHLHVMFNLLYRVEEPTQHSARSGWKAN